MSGSLPTLGIIGAAGRMGTALVQEAGKAGMEIAEAVDAPDRSGSRNPAGGPPFSARPEGKADVYLVFCTGGAVAEHARRCAELGKPLVVGTTAMTPEDLSALEAASRAVAVVRDSNMSLGIAVMRELLRSLRPLADMGFDFEIVEAHHRNKADAPSGTALSLAALFDGLRPVTGRSGAGRRVGDEIGIHAVRAGGIYGEHEFIAASEHEVIRVRHALSSRAALARGALAAARFAARAEAGLYSMEDVWKALLAGQAGR